MDKPVLYIPQMTSQSIDSMVESNFCVNILVHCKYVPEDSYICKKHWIEAKCYHGNPHYIPKWKNIPQYNNNT